jgi:hypothetical protein
MFRFLSGASIAIIIMSAISMNVSAQNASSDRHPCPKHSDCPSPSPKP